VRIMDLQLFAAPEGGPPSPRKRRRAREEGRVPRSADLSAAAVVAAGGLAAALAFPRAGEAFARLLARTWEGAGEAATLSGAVGLLRDAARAALAARSTHSPRAMEARRESTSRTRASGTRAAAASAEAKVPDSSREMWTETISLPSAASSRYTRAKASGGGWEVRGTSPSPSA